MEIKVSIAIDTSPDVVWPVLVDVERWPEWTSSVAAVERLDRSVFGIGTRVRVHQPRLKPIVWRVSEFKPGRVFAWETRGPGLFMVATHEVKARLHGSTVVLGLKQTGWLAPLVNLFFGSLTRRYVQMEAQGLRRRCESSASWRTSESPVTDAME